MPPLRILIAPDKFKGSLTACQVSESIARGWKQARPEDVIESLAISDGGDGFGPLLAGILQAEPRRVGTVDAAHRPCPASWWWDASRRLAIVEAAQSNGLAQLPKGQFHPFCLDTRGVGELLRDVAAARPATTLIGIGGSATNDAGFGMARVLGWRFMDPDGQELPSWTDLPRLHACNAPAIPVRLGEVVVAVDVQNPLLGTLGCTRCYGPQKGLQPADFPAAEAALGRLAEVMRETLARDLAEATGAGAAGGLGFGLAAFLGAQLTSGFDLFARYSGLRERIAAVDLVITGEGRIDDTTLMGKGAGGVARIARELGKRCVALGGGTDSHPGLKTAFSEVWTLTPDFVSLEEALREPAIHLETLARHAASGR